jgi:hypothetical protein
MCVTCQHRLQFAVRGGEYAFAIREGDLAALDQIVTICGQVWNGANSLIVPVSEDAELPVLVDHATANRDVERVFIQKAVGKAGQARLAARFPGRTIQLHDHALQFDLHPLNLQPSFRDPPQGGPSEVLPIPVYDNDALQRIARVACGFIEDAGVGAYGEAFVLDERTGPAAHSALLSSQIAGRSPLAQSTYLMKTYRQEGPFRARRLLVLDDDGFDGLVAFWNLRARSERFTDVVAVPLAAFETADQLRPLLDWGSGEVSVLKPDFLVIVDRTRREYVEAALGSLGITSHGDTDVVTSYLGGVDEDRRQPEFGFTELRLIGGRMRRGLFNENLVSLEPGRNIVRFEPRGFATKHAGGHVRLDLLSWPLPFQPPRVTATRVQRDAFVDDGVVCIVTMAMNSAYTFDLVVPGADDALADFLSEHRLSAVPSPAGRYGTALIGRLGGPQRLEPIATTEALLVLKQLASTSRLKLLQRLNRMLGERYGERTPDVHELAELIRSELVALELPFPSLSDLRSQTKLPQAQLLKALEPLIDVGFIRRGRQERCPECGFTDFYPLDEVAERVVCHACRMRFLLSVAAGHDEPRLSYQLDPLMARAMDQDLLPVLLTLRHLYSPDGAASGAFWPGLEIVRTDGTKLDCDILLAQDGQVTVCECKLSADSLSVAQANATITLAEELGASTVFAAVEGDFNRDIVELTQLPKIRLLTRRDLVPGSG